MLTTLSKIEHNMSMRVEMVVLLLVKLLAMQQSCNTTPSLKGPALVQSALQMTSSKSCNWRPLITPKLRNVMNAAEGTPSASPIQPLSYLGQRQEAAHQPGSPHSAYWAYWGTEIPAETGTPLAAGGDLGNWGRRLRPRRRRCRRGCRRLRSRGGCCCCCCGIAPPREGAGGSCRAGARHVRCHGRRRRLGPFGHRGR